MTEAKRSKENVITVGSGQAYIMAYNGTVPEIDDICKEDNRFGYTKNGATIRYNQEVTELSDDLGKVKKVITSEDSASIQLGLFAWNGTTVGKTLSTARVSEKDGRRTVKIGGVDNDNGQNYVLCFHHHDAKDGDAWWMLVGKNTEGLELGYNQTDGVTLNPTFTAEPMDSEGTLIVYTEEIAAADENAAG